MTKKPRQKCKYLENKKSFENEIKVKFFISFQGLSVAKNCHRPESAPLNTLATKTGLLCNFTKTSKGSHFIENILGPYDNLNKNKINDKRINAFC